MAAPEVKIDVPTLASASLEPTSEGAVNGPAFLAGQIWQSQPSVVVVVRRPG